MAKTKTGAGTAVKSALVEGAILTKGEFRGESDRRDGGRGAGMAKATRIDAKRPERKRIKPKIGAPAVSARKGVDQSHPKRQKAADFECVVESILGQPAFDQAMEGHAAEFVPEKQADWRQIAKDYEDILSKGGVAPVRSREAVAKTFWDSIEPCGRHLYFASSWLGLKLPDEGEISLEELESVAYFGALRTEYEDIANDAVRIVLADKKETFGPVQEIRDAVAAALSHATQVIMDWSAGIDVARGFAKIDRNVADALMQEPAPDVDGFIARAAIGKLALTRLDEAARKIEHEQLRKVPGYVGNLLLHIAYQARARALAILSVLKHEIELRKRRATDATHGAPDLGSKSEAQLPEILRGLDRGKFTSTPPAQAIKKKARALIQEFGGPNGVLALAARNISAAGIPWMSTTVLSKAANRTERRPKDADGEPIGPPKKRGRATE